MGKIYVVTNPMPLHNNSPAVSLGKFIRVIIEAGYSPEIIGARMPESLPGVPEPVPVKSFGYGGKGALKLVSFGLLQVKSFFSCLRRFKKGDAVYFWIADKMIGAFLAAKFRGAEVNYFLYGRTEIRHSKKWARDLEQYMTDHADRVCAEGANVFSECRIPADTPKDVIRLFVPKSEITPKPYAEREPILAVMSRLSAEKHPEDTVRAVCKVRERIPDVRLRIIGGGPIEEQCRALVRELDAEDFITFTGWLSPDEAKENLSECVLLLYPSDYEGVPGGILEAMSFGIPAAASPVGGIPDLIDDGVDGVFLDGTDPETIAESILHLLQSGRLAEMSDAAIKKINDIFSITAAADNFRSVYENCKKKG